MRPEKEVQPEPVSEKPVLEKLVKGRWGSREVEITSIKLLDKSGAEHGLFHTGDKLILEMSYVVNESVDEAGQRKVELRENPFLHDNVD